MLGPGIERRSGCDRRSRFWLSPAFPPHHLQWYLGFQSPKTQTQVESACKLHQRASGKPHSEHLAQLPDEPISLQDAPLGVFRLPMGDPFSEDKTVLWVGIQSLGFALVCDPQENLLLAESTLKYLARTLIDHLKLLSSGNDVVLKADRTEVLLHKFLPHGQLLFLNDQFALGLEREASAAICK